MPVATMRFISNLSSTLLTLSALLPTGQATDLNWHAPRKTDLNNLTSVLAGEGVYGFIFNTSDTPDEVYGTYNWCNMPHVRSKEYVKASDEYELQYVEIVSHPPHVHAPLFQCSDETYKLSRPL